jgi:hypothetical protein
VIDEISDPSTIQSGLGLLAAKVRDDTSVARVWVIVYPPSFEEPEPSPEGTIPELNLPEVVLSDSDGDGEFVGIYEGFTEDGVYRLVVYAEDGEGNVSQPDVLEVNMGSGDASTYLPILLRE